MTLTPQPEPSAACRAAFEANRRERMAKLDALLVKAKADKLRTADDGLARKSNGMYETGHVNVEWFAWQQAWAAGEMAGYEAARKQAAGVTKSTVDCECKSFCECYGRATIWGIAEHIQAMRPVQP